jgi:RNA polymerase sigma-70 factor (ECF subfamily)
MLEIQLINKCKTGDGEAYRLLMNNYRNRLFGYLWRFSDSKIGAEELFQETLIKAWSGIKNYNDQKKFSSWLFTIAHNVAMDNLRKKKNMNNYTEIEEIEIGHSPSTPEDQLIEKETIDRINQSVAHLSEKQRAVFLLRQNGEMSFKEIAESMNEPINTVLSHMRYAIKKIKKQLEKENEPRTRTFI